MYEYQVRFVCVSTNLVDGNGMEDKEYADNDDNNEDAGNGSYKNTFLNMKNQALNAAAKFMLSSASLFEQQKKEDGNQQQQPNASVGHVSPLDRGILLFVCVHGEEERKTKWIPDDGKEGSGGMSVWLGQEHVINMTDVEDVGIPTAIAFKRNSTLPPGLVLERAVVQYFRDEKLVSKIHFHCQMPWNNGDDDTIVLKPTFRYEINVFSEADVAPEDFRLNVVGMRGESGWLPIHISKRNNKQSWELQPADGTVFTTSSSIEPLLEIEVSTSAKKSSWILQKIDIFTSDRIKFCFPCDRMFSKAETVSTFQLRPIARSLTVIIHTQNSWWPPLVTKNQAWIVILGSEGNTGRVTLNAVMDGNEPNYRSNSVDIFHIPTADLGTILQLVIGLDSPPPLANWSIERVDIAEKSAVTSEMVAKYSFVGGGEVCSKDLKVIFTPEK